MCVAWFWRAFHSGVVDTSLGGGLLLGGEEGCVFWVLRWDGNVDSGVLRWGDPARWWSC